MPLALSQSNPDVGASPSFCSGRKLGDMNRPCYGACSRRTRSARSRLLLDEAAKAAETRLRSACASSTGGGCNGSSIVAGDVRVKRHTLGLLSLAQRSSASGPVCRLWACISLRNWLDHQGAFDPVVAQLTQAIETHKHTHLDDDFALLHHREQTLRHRFQALFLPPLWHPTPHRV